MSADANGIEERIRALSSEATSAIGDATNLQGLDSLRIKYLGRKGEIASLFQGLASVDPQDRPRIGKLLNEAKAAIEEALEKAGSNEAHPTQGIIDVTMPGLRCDIGHLHPITDTINSIQDIFISLGFRLLEGPEIETDYYNFEALNIPPNHPSRESFHTFFLDLPAGKDRYLLRSQTSTVQVHAMEMDKPPLRIIASGKVFRPDATDASHSFMFHQIEGFAVDRAISMSDLKWHLELFVKRFFGGTTRMRLRPHYFPFTEPSAEMDISCIICNGKGCRVCSMKGWLEILGCGMIHPAVFKGVRYDAKRWTGFAFGMGIERIAMLKYAIDDIRIFYENDIRFLENF